MNTSAQITWRLRMSELTLWDIMQRRPILTKFLQRLQLNFSGLDPIDREAENCELEIERIRAEVLRTDEDSLAPLAAQAEALMRRVGEAILQFDDIADRAAAKQKSYDKVA